MGQGADALAGQGCLQQRVEFAAEPVGSALTLTLSVPAGLWQAGSRKRVPWHRPTAGRHTSRVLSRHSRVGCGIRPMPSA